MVEVGELPQEFFLFCVEFLWDFDEYLDEQIAVTAAAVIHDSLATYGEHVAALRSGGDGELVRAVEGWYFNFRAKSGLCVGNRQLQNQMFAVAFEQVVRFDCDKAVAITGRSAVGARFAFALQSDPHAVIDAGGDFYIQFGSFVLQTGATALAAGLADLFAGALARRAGCLNAEDARGLDDLALAAAHGAGDRFAAGGCAAAGAGFAGDPSPERDVLVATACGFLERERNVAADIGSTPNASSTATASPRSATEEVTKTASTEQIAERFEDIFDVVVLMGCTFHAGMAVLVVASPFVLVAEYLVGLGRFLEQRDSAFVLISIRVILNCQFAVGTVDLLLGRRSLDVEDFVVTSLGCHETELVRRVVIETGRSPIANGPSLGKMSDVGLIRLTCSRLTFSGDR